MNLWHIKCVRDILNNTHNLTTYWKIPLKITLFNPLKIQTQYTFPINKPLLSLDIVGIHFFINIFYTLLYFFINFELQFLYLTI